MPTPRVQRARQKRERLCIGLLSGTSADGVEAALCRIDGTGPTLSLRLIRHQTFPFPPDFSQQILDLATVPQLSELNVVLGERFAEAAIGLAASAGVPLEEIDVIGSHGQTVAHFPGPLAAHPSTLQIGEASVIAERTGIPTVFDFRTRDMAAGGQGAPLVPYLDWALFRSAGTWRALQNLGGIGNVSVVGDRLGDTVAFDTGPANMILDGLARRATGGRLSCDLDGTLSRQGKVLPQLLEELMRHPFLSQPPPKSAGREGFGEVLIAPLWDRFPDRPLDLIATALAFTVEATADAYRRFILPRFPLEAVYVSGGGSRNPNLMAQLASRLAPLPVLPLDVLGFPEAAKEAALFALLAHEWLSGTPQNVPSATGARTRVILGKMAP